MQAAARLGVVRLEATRRRAMTPQAAVQQAVP
jgi:hypothetical protein